MAAFWTGLAWFLGVYTTKLVYRVMAAIGIGFVTYSGINWVLDQVTAQVQGAFGGMSQTMVDAVTILQIDQALSVILSAYAIVGFLAGSRVLLGKITS